MIINISSFAEHKVNSLYNNQCDSLKFTSTINVIYSRAIITFMHSDVLQYTGQQQVPHIFISKSQQTCPMLQGDL